MWKDLTCKSYFESDKIIKGMKRTKTLAEALTTTSKFDILDMIEKASEMEPVFEILTDFV